MGFLFVSENLALDFVGTLNERRTARVENLHHGDDVARWLVEAGVVDEAPPTDDQTLGAALVVREALFLLIEHLIDHPGDPLSPTAVDVVNGAAAEGPPTLALGRDLRIRRTGSWRSGVSAIARDGLALAGPHPGELKWCADASCTHPFLDLSRGHRRRWCEMSGCGDRAKAAAYRARRRAGAHSIDPKG